MPASEQVGFKGESHTLSGGIHWQLSERLRLAAQGNYTNVQGDFEFDFFQWDLDLSTQVDYGRFGVRVQQVDYHEAGNPDDYGAWMTFVYFTAILSGGK